MPRLEVDIVGNSSGLGKSANEAIGYLGSIEAKYNKVRSAQDALNKQSLALESQLSKLSKGFNDGSISSDDFAKKSDVLKGKISEVRKEASLYSSELARLKSNIDQAANAKPIVARQPVSVQLAGDSANTLNNIGSAANKAFGFVRQLAYILPGVGVAGILGFAVDPIINYVVALGTVVPKVDAVIKSQGVLTQTMLAGSQNAQADITNLKLLFKVYQDANAPLEARKNAYLQLQQLYPSYFGNIAFEEKASKATQDAYNGLTGSILASARARAASNKITENSSRELENETKAIKLRTEIEQLALKVDQARARKKVVDTSIGAGTSELSGAQSQAADRLNKAQDKLNAKAKELREIKVDNNILDSENLRLNDLAVKNLEKGGSLIDLNKVKKPKAQPADRSDKIISSSDKSAELAGLTGADRATETIRQKYISLYASLSDNAKKSASARATYDTDLATLQKNEATEVGAVIVAEQQRTANEITRINNEAGIEIATGREKELARVQKNYDDEVLKARDSSDIIARLNEIRFAKINEINDKYDAIRLQKESDLYSKIQDLSDKNFTVNINGSKRISDKNKEILNDRLKDVSDYFNALRKLNTNGDLGNIVLGITEKGVKKNLANKQATADAPGKDQAVKILGDLASGFGTKFFQTLTTINQQADRSFGAIITEIGSSLTSMLNDVFSTQLSGILKNLVDGTKVNTTQAISAIAGIAGGLISGITSKTSSVGQAAGGALTGAGSGALIGSAFGPGPGTVIGAVAGGLIGAIGGLFGASKARKEQEALQKQQLEEAKKQTELMRQNALTYTAAITGRMTDQGILTNVDIGAMGELKATVSGKQIDFILARNNNSRG